MEVDYKELTIASAFSSAGIGMFGYVKAGFVPVYALEKEAAPAAIFDLNYRYSDGSQVMNVADVKTVSGKDIRAQIKELTGSPVIHLFEQGPSCQDYTGLNTSGKDFGRRELMIDSIKLFADSEALMGVIEEVPRFLSTKNKDISDEYFDIASKISYRSSYMVMNSIHYGSNQARERFFHIFVREDLERDPVFPTPNLESPRRVKDFLDIDHYFSGNFTDRIKTKNDFMSTVTSGSPEWFWKNWERRKPTFEELMLCMDLDPAVYRLPDESSREVVRQAFGNGIPAMLTYNIGKTLIEKVLCLRRNSKGNWVSIA